LKEKIINEKAELAEKLKDLERSGKNRLLQKQKAAIEPKNPSKYYIIWLFRISSYFLSSL